MKTKTLLFVLVLLYSLSFTLWDNCIDCYYWFNISGFYSDVGMCRGSLFLAHLWDQMTEHHLLFFKFFGVLLLWASAIIPYSIVFKNENKYKNLNLLSLGILFLSYWGINASIPDYCALLSLTIIAALIINGYYQKDMGIVVIAILSSFGVLSRFPNVLVALAVLCFMLYERFWLNNKKLNVRKICMYLPLTLVFYIIMFYLIPDRRCGIVEPELMVSSQDSRHTMSFFLYRYITQFVVVALQVVFTVLIILTINKYARVIKKGVIIYFGGCLLILIGCKTLGTLCSKVDPYVGFDWLNYFSACMITLFIYSHWKENKTEGIELPVLLVVFGLIGAAGSDMGLKKMHYFFAAFAPYILWKCKSVIRDNEEISKFLLGTIVLCSVYYSCCWIKNMKLYENIIHTNNVVQLVSNKDMQKYLTIDSYAEEFGTKDKVIYRGFPDCHVLYAKNSSFVPYKYSYWQNGDDKTEFDIISEIMLRDSLFIAIDSNKDESFRKYMAKKKRFKVIDKENALIYICQ